MKIAGLVAEFNPFHYGHKYIIDKIKEDNVDLLILAMSPNFTMRGEPAIFNKFIRTEIALDMGADIVSEIPTKYTIESADIYAKRSIEILNNLKVTDLYFGVESLSTYQLEKIANTMNSPLYKELLNKYLKEGNSFNSSSKKALIDIDKSYEEILNYPNNLLAIEYVKAIIDNNYPIKIHPIKRIEAEYYDELVDDNKLIQSASSLRNESKNNDISKYLPYSMNNIKKVYMEDTLSHLKTLISNYSKNDLLNINLINEGLENNIKNIKDFSSIDSIINQLISKRNRPTKIKRILMNILLNIKKDEINNEPLKYIRILGIKKDKTSYLNEINNINIITSMKRDLDKDIYREIDFTKIYSILSNEDLELNEYKMIIK